MDPGTAPCGVVPGPVWAVRVLPVGVGPLIATDRPHVWGPIGELVRGQTPWGSEGPAVAAASGAAAPSAACGSRTTTGMSRSVFVAYSS